MLFYAYRSRLLRIVAPVADEGHRAAIRHVAVLVLERVVEAESVDVHDGELVHHFPADIVHVQFDGVGHEVVISVVGLLGIAYHFDDAHVVLFESHATATVGKRIRTGEEERPVHVRLTRYPGNASGERDSPQGQREYEYKQCGDLLHTRV